MTVLINDNNAFDGVMKLSRYFTTLENKQGKKYTVFQNPTISEVNQYNLFGEHDWFRAILDEDGNIYAWKSYDDLHFNVAQKLGITDFVGLIVYSDGGFDVTDSTSKKFYMTDLPKKMIEKNNWIKEQFPDQDYPIRYFNDAIEGDWAQ